MATAKYNPGQASYPAFDPTALGALDQERLATPREWEQITGARYLTTARKWRMLGKCPRFIRLANNSRGRVGYRIRDLLEWARARATFASTAAESWSEPAVGSLLRGDGA